MPPHHDQHATPGPTESANQEVQADDAIAISQREVQRKLGRSVLQLQQYELLLKELIVHSEESGTIDTLLRERDERTQKLKLGTLGTLVKNVPKFLIREVPFEELPDSKVPPDKIHFRVRMNLGLPPEEAALVEAELKQLVELRNELVHHFLERFDVFSTEGCHSASAYLDKSHDTIKTAYTQLSGWAENLQQLRQEVGVYIQSDSFKNEMKSQLRPPTGTATDDPT